ncbi:MAG: formate dehydrogenase accessory sulfurtransferase FdhD [Burkholderiales bacterium]|nr:formate dehydrogenase accessory sulfurtransferase FdhD [Burkholderiales bacterium]
MLPRLTQAQAPLTREIEVMNEQGVFETVSIPAERPLTIYVDKHELITLMTLGAHPEWLVLGYLRNQRLVLHANEVESITVDWEAGEDGAGVAAVKTRQGLADLPIRTEHRVVTTGCGQGSVFGGLMDEIDALCVPEATISQSRLYALLNAIRLQESTYKSAGSVHGCALFAGERMQLFVEDVGRHNAIDTIAGWMWMQDHRADPDSIFYTTGRLTSEMVMKSAQMGVAIVVSRSGITQMGFDLAQRLSLCTIGRAINKHFLCYTQSERLIRDIQNS